MVFDMNFEKFKAIIREKLDDYRYNHSLCVAEEAKRLAILYGEDPEEAYLAGLLHDITKNFSCDEHLNIFNEFGIILTDIEKASIPVWHGISASVYVKNIIGIENENIISAIRYHTTGKSNMSLFEKLIYLADFTSADRNYPDVEVMRNLVNISIEDAMLYSLKFTITDLARKDRAIHTDTLNAYNEIQLNKMENDCEIRKNK